MKARDIDWKILRGGLIALTVSLAVSSSLVYGGNYFRTQMLQEFNRANAQFRSISSRYLAVDEEEKLIRTYLPRFVELYKRGVIGTEQRLNWIEMLRTSGEEMRIPSLSYQIESQQVYNPAYSLNMGRFRLYSSKMSLNMTLLHEGDLFRLLAVLDEKVQGRYSLASCRISQAASEITDNPDAGNIMVRCDLQWYTIRLADGKPIDP